LFKIFPAVSWAFTRKKQDLTGMFFGKSWIREQIFFGKAGLMAALTLY
jgi:hypothetical protein